MWAMRYISLWVGSRLGSIPVSRRRAEARLSVGWGQILVGRGRWVALGLLLLLLLRSLVLRLLLLLGSSVLLLRSLVRGLLLLGSTVLLLWSTVLLLWGTVLLSRLLLAVSLWFLVGRVLWSGSSFGVQLGV